MSSLSARLLVSISLLLILFFGATIVVLDVAFRQAGEQAQEDILDTQLMALIAEAEPNADGELVMPPDLREPDFGNLGSGLYGALSDETDSPVWTSRSGSPRSVLNFDSSRMFIGSVASYKRTPRRPL